MGHHTHPVEGWLTVEQDIITILKSSLDHSTIVEVFLNNLRGIS